MTQIFAQLLFKSLIIWIDDLLGHADTEEKWFEILSQTLELAENFNLKFSH